VSVRIKGAVLNARRVFAERQFGKDAWNRVVSTLSREDQKILTGVLLNAGWYPFDVCERLDKAIVKVLGRGDPTVFARLGAVSAQENLSGVHRNFLSPGDPQAFMAKTGLIYRFYYDTGRREYEATGPNSGAMTTYDAETFSETDCHTVMGWYEEALKMCGARTAEVVHDVCRAKGGAVCRYRVKWEM
jgi:uncharacterized protein (TIGR02265 family)